MTDPQPRDYIYEFQKIRLWRDEAGHVRRAERITKDGVEDLPFVQADVPAYLIDDRIFPLYEIEKHPTIATVMGHRT